MIYEAITVGDTHDFGTKTFTAEDIKRFATLYDPQPFHVDEAAGAASLLGGLCASGWHTAAAMMALQARYLARLAERLAPGQPPTLGPSPGFDNLKWIKPVYPDDTITFSGLVVAKRISESRPAWGIVSVETTGTNQSGEPVFSYTGHVFVARA
ncbi:MaoC family dehydratase [Bauldia sp.]|uniref:MaoC family dehydratase n=1 Tax=Bauldia sp. TaxID=2575872 RepID=UPI003BAAF355